MKIWTITTVSCEWGVRTTTYPTVEKVLEYKLAWLKDIAVDFPDIPSNLNAYELHLALCEESDFHDEIYIREHFVDVSEVVKGLTTEIQNLLEKYTT